MINFDQILLAINGSKVLSQNDKEFFILYHLAMNQSEGRLPEDNIRLSKEIIKRMNDKNFNYLTTAFEKEISSASADPQNILVFHYLDLLKILSYELPNACYFENLIQKTQRGIYITSNGGTLERTEKLSLAELGVLARFEKIKRCLGFFETKNIDMMSDKQYRKIVDQCAKIESLKSQLNNLYDPNVYKNGDVVVTDIDKTDSFKLKHTRANNYEKEGMFQSVKKRFTPYGHAAQLTTSNQKIKQSHMWGVHKLDDFSFNDIVESDIFRINIAKLVDASQEEALKQALGDNWEKELQDLFAKKIEAISNDNLLKNLKIIDGIRSATAILPHFLGRKTNQNRGLFYNPSTTEKDLFLKEMICSDFVARETNEAIHLVNQELVSRNLKITIKLPFPEWVNLSRVTPSELIQLLNNAGCLEKVENEKVNTLINTQNNYSSLSHKHVELTICLYEKMHALAKRSPSQDTFIKEAKVAFIGYLDANESLDLKTYAQKANEIDSYLDKCLPALYERNCTNQAEGFIAAFCEFFTKFIYWLGFTDSESKEIIHQTVNYLEKNCPASLRDIADTDSDPNSDPDSAPGAIPKRG